MAGGGLKLFAQLPLVYTLHVLYPIVLEKSSVYTDVPAGFSLFLGFNYFSVTQISMGCDAIAWFPGFLLGVQEF